MLFFRPSIFDEDLNIGAVGCENLLDNSAARHRLSVRPKKNHMSSQLQRSVSPQPPFSTESVTAADEKYETNSKQNQLSQLHSFLHFSLISNQNNQQTFWISILKVENPSEITILKCSIYLYFTANKKKIHRSRETNE